MVSVSVRLRQLEEIEKDVVKAVRVAGQCLQELSKDPTSQLVTKYTTTFLATLQSVDQRLSEQIAYLSQVSTSQWHGDSVYLAERVLTVSFRMRNSHMV
jgi:mediator of RNA polymerase II transcription subunit 11